MRDYDVLIVQDGVTAELYVPDFNQSDKKDR